MGTIWIIVLTVIATFTFDAVVGLYVRDRMLKRIHSELNELISNEITMKDNINNIKSYCRVDRTSSMKYTSLVYCVLDGLLFKEEEYKKSIENENKGTK